MKEPESCFFCEYLGKDIMECTLDKEHDIIFYLIFEKPDWCPLKNQNKDKKT